MTASIAPSAAPERAPSVLVVLAVRDAAEWLRECLQALAVQTYPRLGVLAIDDASTDGSHEILVQALGDGRVIRHEERLGLSRSFHDGVAHPVAGGADFVLLLHDDAALDPEAVTRLVEATTLEGAERVGIVGAKVVDWDHPRRLRDVGRSADRFGHPYSPLQEEEIDQGQFDRVLEVLSVDSCAMLVAREVWQTTGLFDERLGDDDGDVDLCWRVRLAGWSVLMTPLARVRHAAAAERDDAPGTQRSRRYEEDRAALASVLKNDGLATLAWVVPLGAFLSIVRLLYLTLSRRFEEAYDLLAAVGWNMAHLPSTLRARRAVQKHRRVHDHELRRFTESAGLRLPRWFMTAERILEEQRELEAEELEDRAAARLRHRTVSFVSAHPVIVASFLGIVVGALSFRGVFGAGRLYGGAIPAFPTYASGFFAELISAYRTTPLGGNLAASPALAAMGGLSTLLFGSTSLAQKVMVGAGPALAAILCYRAAVRLTGRPGPCVVAAAAYGLSAIVLSAFSEGRIALLVALAVLPPLVERLEVAFAPEEPPDGRWRLIAGLAVTIAVGAAFVPGVILAVGVIAVVQLLTGSRRRRGSTVVALAVVGAAILVFPFVPALVANGGAALGSELGTSDPWHLVRLTFDDGPATWGPALFLPIAAVLGLALAGGDLRRPALRAALIATAGLALSWLSSAGYLPAALTDTPIYLAMSATAEAFLVGFGLSSALGGLERESFGFRQVGTALITVTVAGGILIQSVAAMTAEWAIGGPDRIPAAWAVVDSASKGAFRVLWVGGDDGRSFPAPGGDPQGVVEAGAATLRYGLTGRAGAVAIDTARPFVGQGPDAMRQALGEVLSGTTVHGGALLAPFGIRYVVASEDELSVEARARLDAQVDLDLVPNAGLVIWRNAAALPPAGVLQADLPTARTVASDRPEDLQDLTAQPATPLAQVEGGWSGPTGGGNLAVVSTEYDGAWTVAGDPAATPARAFGWATSLPATGSAIDIRYGAQLPSTVAAWVLAAVWAAALWITRKPVAR
jgi:GT2 family glycosyltransferase